MEREEDIDSNINEWNNSYDSTIGNPVSYDYTTALFTPIQPTVYYATSSRDNPYLSRPARRQVKKV